jgi:leucyl/phenylalanyl-tRNA--protein transferase
LPIKPIKPIKPIEPPATDWHFPDPRGADGDVVGVGADLEPGTVLAAYRAGVFPMPAEDVLAWWSPEQRGILPLDGLRISRSLRKSLPRFEVRIDTSFAAVVEGCADPSRSGSWITADIAAAYCKLHELGWAHSVEAWSRETGRLAGGLYGVAIGGLFAGESMFHQETDASKAALVHLVSLLRDRGASLLDVQWLTPHLASLGAVEIPRADYLARLPAALARPALF